MGSAVKAFEFRLEKILRLRRHQEKEWEHRMAEANAACAGFERAIAEATARRDEAVAGRLEGDVEDMLVRERYIGRLDLHIAGNRTRLAEGESAREEVRRGYNEAMAARKALENLRDRQKEEHHRASVRHEIMSLDELSQSSHRRSRKAAGGDIDE